MFLSNFNVCFYLLSTLALVCCISNFERISLRNEAREMFIHAYDSYMKYAYPADELMPLSCKGRYRDVQANRGDVDDALGNFSLTLIDTLDTLVILGNYSEFENAVFRVVNEVTFDSDIVVSVFETNIRVVGGLLSAHIMAVYLKQNHNMMIWYHEHLLNMAKDVGYRLLPAFDTTTGIPHPRVNLRYGMKSHKIGSLKETCTSCAGTMILEFAALSRLAGDPIFEIKARKAMDYLWKQRHRQSDLVGNVINIHSGDWIRKESGVGAGIDSYYEYCLKAYILLGDENYLHRFNRHYAGIMKYVSRGPLLVDVHMHRPHNVAKNFMDSLLAFWPGLQVLKGDLKPAIELHEILYQITQKHKFLPEAFTIDFNVHWPHHPLRPEFLESTYFLFQATNDEHYLQVGKEALLSIQNYTRVPCGFAAMNDVRTQKKEDRMDSFFLAETLKYLYLLFSNKNEIDLNLDEYIFTTEAHLLPLSLSYMNETSKKFDRPLRWNNYLVPNSDYSCPATKEVIKSYKPKLNIDNLNYYRMIRLNFKDFVSKPTEYLNHKNRSPRIRASEFSVLKSEHVEMVKQLGISVVFLKDGRVQLIHNSAAAETKEDADEGAFFMQEIINLSKQQVQNDNKLLTVSFTLPARNGQDAVQVSLLAGPAQFGPDLATFDDNFSGYVVKATPIDACVLHELEDDLLGHIALVQRGNCMFVEKARNVQKMGAIGLIVFDNVENSSSKNNLLFAMSSDGPNDVKIPSIFLYTEDAKILINSMEDERNLKVTFELQNESDSSSNPVQSNEDSKVVNNESGDYFKELTKIFNIFSSDKLKFDLLSSLNLKRSRKPAAAAASVNTFLMDSKDLQRNVLYNPLAAASSCKNPHLYSEYFIPFILSTFHVCMA